MSYYAFEFTAPVVVHRIGHLRYLAVFLPPALEPALGLRGHTAAAGRRHARVRMVGEIADMPIEAAWQSAGEGAAGGYYVMVSQAFCRAAGLAIGDLVDVRFNIADPAAVTVPEELDAALQARTREARDARRTWKLLTPGRQRALAAHVAGARQVTTRTSRAAKIVAALARGEDPLARPARAPTR
jgi:hypothetical protein